MRRQPWSTFYFSAQGRVPRSEYWLYLLIPAWVCNIALRLLGHVAGALSGHPHLSAGIASVLVAIVTGWPSIVLSAKRLHDRGRSGWWLLANSGPFIAGSLAYPFASGGMALLPVALFAVTVLASLWLCLELCVLSGTAGDNRFGLDPLSARPVDKAAESATVIAPPPKAAPDRAAWRTRFR